MRNKKKKKQNIAMKRIFVDDETSDGGLHDSDDPDDIQTDDVSSSNGKEEVITTEDTGVIIKESYINDDTDSDSSSVIIDPNEEEKFMKTTKTKKLSLTHHRLQSKSHSQSQQSISPNRAPPKQPTTTNYHRNKKNHHLLTADDNKDELKDMEEENAMNSSKLRGKYGELCLFSKKFKSYGIGLSNHNKVAHKNHNNFHEDYVLLDVKPAVSGIKCWRFHNTEHFALWGIVCFNDKYNEWDLKRFYGCCTENTIIRSGKYMHNNNEYSTEQWCGKLVDMMLDLNRGELKFCSPNFIEPKNNMNKLENKKLNDIIVIDGINRKKKWCPILKLKQTDTFIMAREIAPEWFGKYSKAVKFEPFTHV